MLFEFENISNWLFTNQTSTPKKFHKNKCGNRTGRQNVYLHRTITKYHSTTIFHSFFICHTKLRTRKNLQFIGNLPENQKNNNSTTFVKKEFSIKYLLVAASNRKIEIQIVRYKIWYLGKKPAI